MLAAFLIYPAGYLLVHVEPRFFWPMALMLFLMAAYVLDRVSKPWWLLAGVMATFVLLPAWHLIEQRHTGRQFHELAQRLSAAGISGNVASNGNWNATLYLSHHLSWRYHGYSGETDPDRLDQQLREHSIDYFVAWDDSVPALQNYLEQYQPVIEFDDPAMTVYRLK
jgi:hypothetical protein